MTRRPAEEIPEKAELVLACYTEISQNLEWRVIDFNRANEHYHVTVEIFDGEEGLRRMDASLLSSDPPDLIELTWLDIGKYADKMLLEDLTSYLEDSSVLDKDDFLEEIIDAYTLNGQLVCIPAYFWLNTLMGRASQVGNTPGWDMGDVIALADAYPEYSLFDKYGFANNIFFTYGDYIVGRYIDWDKGECSFDSGEFQSVIEWIAEHSDGRGYQNGYDWRGEDNQLVYRTTLYNPKNLALSKAYCDNEAVAIGYPSPDGKALHQAQIRDVVGITVNSEQKEGAWLFLEYLLSYMPPYDEIMGFSSHKDILALAMEGAMNPEYDVENAISQEDVNQMMEMISAADFPLQYRGGGKRYEILNIIMDEINSYFDGYKSLEDVSVVIQNRVTTLVQEDMQDSGKGD